MDFNKFILEFFTKVLLQHSDLILNPSLVNWHKLVNLQNEDGPFFN